MQELQKILDDALQSFAAIEDAAELENAKARYLGKEGSLTGLLKGLGKLSAEERPAAGARINQVKQQIEAALQAQRDAIQNRALNAKLAAESLDVTLPGRGTGVGGLHPVTRTLERIETLFHSIGYAVAEGPEIENDFYNFTALNIPADHPARAMHDTFYIDEQHVLRTHTSPIQIRYMQAHMEKYKHLETMPDIRIIAPGRVYRVDSDATHSPMFHQVEGLWVGEKVSFADLKGVIADFLQNYFETEDMQGALPSFVLPVHRTFGRDGHELEGRLAGDRRLRHGASERAQACRHRQREIHRLRLRHGRGATGHAALRCERPQVVLRE